MQNQRQNKSTSQYKNLSMLTLVKFRISFPNSTLSRAIVASTILRVVVGGSGDVVISRKVVVGGGNVVVMEMRVVS